MEDLKQNQKLFSPIITQAVKAKLYEFDGMRVNLNEKKQKIWLVFALAALGIAFGAWRAQTFQILFAIPVLAMIVVGYLSYSKQKVASMFKNEILTKQLVHIKEVEYYPHKHISINEFLSSGLFRNNRIDRYNGEDLFVGKRGKTNYRFSEILAEEKHTTTDSKGRTHTTWVTVFNGIMMIADFNKKISSETRVIQRTETIFDNWFTNKTKVTLESPEFEKMFDTYSTDQVEARYILTPAMMERIIRMQKNFGSKVRLSFRGNNVYVAISDYRNFFEADMNQPINPQQIERIFGEIKNCVEIIDVLDLNTRIWTKK